MAAPTHLSRRGCARRTWDPSCVPGDLQHPQPSAGDPQPGPEKRSPRLDSSSETYTNTHTHTHTKQAPLISEAIFPLPRYTCGDTACYLFISCVSLTVSRGGQNCVLARRGRTSLAGENTPKHAKRLSFCRPLVFLFPVSFFSCDLFPAAKPGTRD